tara:strand:- start:5374 stop:6312 length:939 start_codon:yes stop_codon:yes gene_type:complete
MSLFIYPYRTGSASAAALRTALNAKIIRREGSKFKGHEKKIVLNWGCSVTPEEVEKATVLNPASAVKLATNKKTFFEKVTGEVNIPEFTTDQTVANGWLLSGGKVVVRETLTGHSAEGLVMLEDVSSWDSYDHSRAKLYVKYVPKKDEYRIHVVSGEVVDVQQKAMSSRVDSSRVNWQVRNHQNGFIYKREGVEAPEVAKEQAILATELCGLHYGAVDVIWNAHYEKAYVLEVNTAPGLEGQTVNNISEALEQAIQRMRDVPPPRPLTTWDLPPEPGALRVSPVNTRSARYTAGTPIVLNTANDFLTSEGGF